MPCIDLSFEIFAAAYAEVWLKPGKRSFDDYEFPLPWIEEKNDLVLLENKKFLGYHYLVLTPEDLGYSFGHQTELSLPLLSGLEKGLQSQSIIVQF